MKVAMKADVILEKIMTTSKLVFCLAILLKGELTKQTIELAAIASNASLVADKPIKYLLSSIKDLFLSTLSTVSKFFSSSFSDFTKVTPLLLLRILKIND